MIPKLLILKNFLSYREVALDFDGLHVACVCGPNGSGKSSLLEAIAWCVWGQSRVSTEDDIVRQGSAETQVSFIFEHSGQTYRIIRTRRRNQSSALEFQIKVDDADSPVSDRSEHRFRSITQKGVRATQQYILSQIKIDYDTFVNSAYLRQGRADEFMLKRPAERKQVLADLLKLNHYDTLAEQAKDRSRSYKAQQQQLESLLARLSVQIEAHEDTQQAYETLQRELTEQQTLQKRQQQQLIALQKQQQQRIQQAQQKQYIQQQSIQKQQALADNQVALKAAEQQIKATESTLAQAEEIQRRCAYIAKLKQTEEQQAERFEAYQEAQSQRLSLQQQISQMQHKQQHSLAQVEGQLAQLHAQEQEIQAVLEKKEEIYHKLSQLRLARKELHQLDKKEAQSSPLRQRLQQIERQIGQAHTRLVTRIEELGSRQAQMTTQHQQAPQLMQAAVEASHRIAYLEQRRDYQEALRQKGLERRSFMERLQANQLNYEVTLAQFEQRLKLLGDPDTACCPLCDQRLTESSWQVLRDQTLRDRDDVQNQIWAIREQLAVSEREIQVLRQEYRVLEKELSKYAPILEERGQLRAKLASADTLQDRLQEMTDERSQLERCLQENDYAESLQAELQRVRQQLEAMAYDDRNHALLRSQVDRLRWSELKHAEVKQAERRLKQIQMQRPGLEAQLQSIRQALSGSENSSVQQALLDVNQRLSKINYSLAKHNQIRAELKQSYVWESRSRLLQQAQNDYPKQKQRASLIADLCERQQGEVKSAAQQILCLEQQLMAQGDLKADIAEIEAALTTCQQVRDRQLSQVGRLQQQLSQLAAVQEQHEQQQTKLADTRHKHQVYRSLAEAFGRNGIQALMIENLLPQLEAQTNQILGRLSDHQLHVQFVTQRAGRKRNKQQRLIDTLDILIADAFGTRPYETYSGGEAFRVNFSIRLAIARLLAMRSGTALQMLIVDEGFGTQDKDGCDRLIAAIEAIAPDFACILTITHMPHFREAFQTRIDVSKDNSGSHIAISG